MANDARTAMDQMYRMQRHIYDFTRKYYLLGRDRLIDELKPVPGQRVCEIGCGTARNLVRMAKRYPEASWYGFDASDEMLKTAHGSLHRAGLDRTVTLAQGFAQNFDPATLFGLDEPFDIMVFSYSLSMIPPWRESIDHALTLLPSGGRIEVVDFGDQAGLPRWFRRLLFGWLSLFHVEHRPEMLAYFREVDRAGRCTLELLPLYRGYAYIARLTKA